MLHSDSENLCVTLIPPFISRHMKNMSIMYSCIKMFDGIRRVCPTKVNANQTIMKEKYSVATASGICPSKCNGEKFSSESNSNLAKVIKYVYYIREVPR